MLKRQIVFLTIWLAFWSGFAADQLLITYEHLQPKSIYGDKVIVERNGMKFLIDKDRVKNKPKIEVENGLDKILENANINLENGLFEEARNQFQEVLDEDNKNITANVGVVKSHIAEKNFDIALNKLNSIPKEIEKEPVFKELNSEIELLNKVSKTRSFDNIQRDLEKNPNSLDLKFELALSQIANEEYEDSIENLLNIFKIDKSWENGKAKDQLILLFDTLGNKNELVLKARRKLSSIIFS